MSVILRKRKNGDGSISLRLDIYRNGRRTVETLKSLKLAKASNVKDREENKVLMQQAEAIRVARAAELEANNYSLVTDTGKRVIIAAWMQKFIDGYTKKDKRNLQGALNRFIAYLAEKKLKGLTFIDLTALVIEDFMDYLETNSVGEGASSYFKRFKKMVKQAYRKKLMKDNVLDLVERKIKGKAKKKDILTLEELGKLSLTPIANPEIRRAFLFSCVTGLRWCDIKILKWQDIHMASRQMSLTQSKTEENVTIPLNDTAMKLLGEPKSAELWIFSLPTANGANKTLKAWVKRAKLHKKITWHNARHSFGTNLIFNDVDVLTASKLLGHTTISHTQRYVKAAEEMKQAATDKINITL
jgi:integrase/recombinase XerD